MALHALG
jgi:stress-induced-phosphoprotein 1